MYFRLYKRKSKSEDEDYHYMMSLIPEIKKVPQEHKLKLKAEINLLFPPDHENFLQSLSTPEFNRPMYPQ